MQSQDNPVQGILLVLAATLLFAAADTLVKYLAVLHFTALILATRYTVNLMLVTVIMWPRYRASLWRTQRTGLVILRALCLAFASVTMLMALRLMPVAETVAIIYIAPVLVMLAAGTVLGEKVGLTGWISAALGFAGVLLIARPESGLDPAGVALALVNACFATGYILLSRVLSRTESTMALMFHTALVGSVVFVAVVVALGTGPWPKGLEAMLMLGLGALATAGHLLFTLAYRKAPASTLAPINYMHIAFATALGWMVFRQVPDAFGFLGMAVIAVAGLLAVWRAPGQTPAPDAATKSGTA